MLRWFASWRRGRRPAHTERSVPHPSSPPPRAALSEDAEQLRWAPRNDDRFRDRIPDGDTVPNPGYPRWSQLVTRELPLAGPAPSYVRPFLERDRKARGEARGG